MAEREAWYVLEGGRAVHPSEVQADENGRLVHESGLVAMRFPDCPMTRNVDPDEMDDSDEVNGVEGADGEADGQKPAEDQKKRRYKTRVMKAQR